MSAKVTTYDQVPMLATARCDRCGAQAYVEVHVAGSKLLFCAHDYEPNEAKLTEVATEILDHRPYLRAVETQPV